MDVSLPPNPFTTRHTRPGTLPPLAADGRPLDIATLIRELMQAGGTGIEGPHGSGKSTLLTAMAAKLADDGLLAGCLRLRGRRDAWAALGAICSATAGQVVCLDGWETLGLVAAVARMLARTRGVRLVVTSHRPTGLPLVVRTTTTVALLAAIVHRLPDHAGLIADADLPEAFASHRGDLREALLDLYDRFELRARQRRL